MKMYIVGGTLRDIYLQKKPKDYDFAVEAESFDAMVDELKSQGFTVYLASKEYLTVRARIPFSWPDRWASIPLRNRAADFVLCRKDGVYSDGRRPDSVTPGTIYDDLERRDFTVNAMALTSDGVLIDPHDGMRDLENETLRCVGSAVDRLDEDALRALRALRFAVTLDFEWDEELFNALRSKRVSDKLHAVSVDRRREEISRAMRHDTYLTIETLSALPSRFTESALKGLRLEPTSRK